VTLRIGSPLTIGRLLRRRWFWFWFAACLLLASTTVFVPAIRVATLRAAGWALVVDNHAGCADLFIVGGEADGAGVLEIADLLQQCARAQVAVFADPPDPVDLELERRGLPYTDGAIELQAQLSALGLGSSEIIPRTTGGTGDEGRVLPEWCDQRPCGSVVIVTTTDHSRRVQRVLRRAMRGHKGTVTVRPSRYSEFDPDRWWLTHQGIRTGIVEIQKLLLDVLRHPL